MGVTIFFKNNSRRCICYLFQLLLMFMIILRMKLVIKIEVGIPKDIDWHGKHSTKFALDCLPQKQPIMIQIRQRSTKMAVPNVTNQKDGQKDLFLRTTYFQQKYWIHLHALMRAMTTKMGKKK